jgi:phosphocarrier protein HPr
MPVKRTLTITNMRGLHARASRKLAEIALTYESAIVVRKDDESADARSLMDLMMLGAGRGMEIEVEADGADELEALDAIAALVANKFDEGE